MFFDLDGIINFRDLGGMMTEDGRRIKENMLFRCGELEKASEEDIRCLSVDFGIRTIIDFRDPDEQAERPDPSVPGARYINIPALPPMIQPKERMKEAPPPEAMEIFPRIYRQLAESEESIKAYRQFFRLILEENASPVLWHCRQGKDRTGVAAILLMTALGVSMKDCVAEYLLTNDYMAPRVEAYRRTETVSWKIQVMDVISFVREPWLNEYLAIADARHGGLKNYLKEILGLKNGDMETLRRLYLE